VERNHRAKGESWGLGIITLPLGTPVCRIKGQPRYDGASSRSSKKPKRAGGNLLEAIDDMLLAALYRTERPENAQLSSTHVGRKGKNGKRARKPNPKSRYKTSSSRGILRRTQDTLSIQDKKKKIYSSRRTQMWWVKTSTNGSEMKCQKKSSIFVNPRD